MSIKKRKKEKEAKPSKERRAEKKAKKAKGPREGSRRAYIIGLIKAAGKKGILAKDLVTKVDKGFDYDDGGSRTRVMSTIRSAIASKEAIRTKDGHVCWSGK